VKKNDSLEEKKEERSQTMVVNQWGHLCDEEKRSWEPRAEESLSQQKYGKNYGIEHRDKKSK
jgi:hypothetical protein